MSVSGTAGRGGSFVEAARRAQIIEAAIATVSEAGYPGVTLDGIAERLGTDVRVVGYHFADREELLLRVVDQVFGSLERVTRQAMADNGPDPAAQIRAYIRAHAGFVQDHRAAVAAALEIAIGHRGAQGVPLILIVSEDETAMIGRVISAGITQRAFRDLDLSVAATSIVHAAAGVVTQAQTYPDTDLVVYGEELADFVLAGLGWRGL